MGLRRRPTPEEPFLAHGSQNMQWPLMALLPDPAFIQPVPLVSSELGHSVPGAPGHYSDLGQHQPRGMPDLKRLRQPRDSRGFPQGAAS